MAKVTLERELPPPAPPPKVTVKLELNELEARALRTLLGAMGGCGGEIRMALTAIYYGLGEAGVRRLGTGSNDYSTSYFQFVDNMISVRPGADAGIAP